MDMIEELYKRIAECEERLSELEVHEKQNWVMLTSPLTSTSWDGDAYSTTAKTLIDLSAIFGAPAGIKSVLLKIAINDSGSAANNCVTRVAPNNTADQGLSVRCSGIANDAVHEGIILCPCNSDGDIYYQINASGSLTMDVVMQIWGYLL